MIYHNKDINNPIKNTLNYKEYINSKYKFECLNYLNLITVFTISKDIRLFGPYEYIKFNFKYKNFYTKNNINKYDVILIKNENRNIK